MEKSESHSPTYRPPQIWSELALQPHLLPATPAVMPCQVSSLALSGPECTVPLPMALPGIPAPRPQVPGEPQLFLLVTCVAPSLVLRRQSWVLLSSL